MNLARSVALTTASLVVGRFVVIVTGLGAIALASRYLGLDDFGALTIAMAFVSLFAVFTDLGLSTIATREIARAPDREREILGSVLSLGLAAAAVVGAVAFGLVQLVYPGDEQAEIRQAVLILLVQIVCAPFVGAARAHFVAGQRGHVLALGDVAQGLVIVTAAAAVVVFDLGFAAMVGAMTAGYVAQAVVLTAVIRRPVRLALAARRAAWVELLAPALPLGATLVVNFLYFRLDIILLSLLLTQSDVAVYGIAYRVVEALMVLPGYLMLALFPEISRLRAEPARVDAIMREALRVMELVALPVVLLTILLAPEIVQVIGGDELADAVPVLQILMLAVGGSYLAGVYGNALPALDLQRPMLWFALVVLAANLALNLALIPTLGVEGAALAVALSEVLGLLAVRRLYARAGTPPRMVPELRVLAAAALMSAVVAAKLLLPGAAPALVVAIGVGSLGLVVYAAALLALRAVPEVVAVHLPAALTGPGRWSARPRGSARG